MKTTPCRTNQLRKKQSSAIVSSEVVQESFSSKKTQELLPEGEPPQTVPLPVTEGSTKILDKVNR